MFTPPPRLSVICQYCLCLFLGFLTHCTHRNYGDQGDQASVQSLVAPSSSGSNTVLLATRDPGFSAANCVLITENGKTRNLTQNGGLSEDQLRIALSYASYPAHILTGFVPGSVAILGLLDGESSDAVILMGAIGFFTPGGIIPSAIAEYFLRGQRYSSIQSKRVEDQITTKQMEKFIEKIASTSPAYTKACRGISETNTN